MYSNNFSVRIPEGVEVRDQYVKIRHGATYSIVMRNDRMVPCDAVVSIDGKEVGVWRIPSRNSIRIERPVERAKLFTFYRLGSPESTQAGLVDDSDLGLISVQFKPAKEMFEFESYGPSVSRGGAKGLTRGGGTGLSGHSFQQFTSVAALDYDMSRAYTIHLRLIPDESADIEPLVARSTPVPPRITSF